MPILTQELLDSGLSSHGAYNLAQLHVILPQNEFTGNGTWSLRKGWKQRLIGREINQSQFEEFLSLKDKHLGIKINNSKQLTFENLSDSLELETDLYPGKPELIEYES